MSREAILLAAIFDSSEANRLGKKFKPSKKPWPREGSERLGRTDLTPVDAKALLKRNRDGLNT